MVQNSFVTKRQLPVRMNLGKKSVPKSKFIFQTCLFTDKSEKHERCIRNHTFNHRIDLLIPGTDDPPDGIFSELSEQMYYLLDNVAVSWLLSDEFIEAFIRKGSMYMLSQKTCIDTDDCIALLPTGHLILNVTRETYLSLGLDGSVSKYYKKHKDKYVVTINLLSNEFKEGSKLRARARWCLEKWPKQFSFLLTWQPNDPKICSSSISSYVSTKWKAACHECCIKATKDIQRYLQIPVIEHSDVHETDSVCGFVKFFEWLGAVSQHVNCSGTVDSYVNTYCCPEPHATIRQCLNLSLKGFFTTDSISVIVNLLRNKLLKNADDVPWAAITVHGFQDCPVSWGQREHGYYDNGDNFYSIVLLPKNDGVWIYEGLGFLDLFN